MNPAPIILFVYNRPTHTALTLEALKENTMAGISELIVFADGPKAGSSPQDLINIEKVRSIVSQQSWCKKLTVNMADSNRGLADSVIYGVSEMFKKHERLIVLEDDMVTSPHFLQFMNESLEKYEKQNEVISVHGFCLPIDYNKETFFLKGADCWGWATWKRGWKIFNPDSKQLMKELKGKKLLYRFDFDGCNDYSGMLEKQIEGKIDSWAIRWYASAFLQNKLTLYSAKSLIVNIGADGSGTHAQNAEATSTVLFKDPVKLEDIPISESFDARELICAHYYKYAGMKMKLRKWLKWKY